MELLQGRRVAGRSKSIVELGRAGLGGIPDGEVFPKRWLRKKLFRWTSLVFACLLAGGCGGGSGGGESSGSEVEIPVDTHSAPVVRSPYLSNPDSVRNVIAGLADFRTRVRDDVDGGFYSYLRADGSLGQSSPGNELSGWSPTNKSFVTQTRDVYSFARAFMVTGNKQYLEHARHAYDFLLRHGRDNVNGGWYFVADAQGTPADCPNCSTFWNPNTFKWSFVQHYIPLGFGALCEATREADVCASFTEAKRDLNAMRDSANGGYYETAAANYANPEGKSFASTVDALNTHAFFAYQNGSGLSEINELATLTAEKFIGSFNLDSVAFGFPDIFTADWTPVTDRNQGSVGHLLKASWMLARAYLLTNNDRYRQAAKESINEVLDNGGWDYSNGIPYTSYNWQTGEVNTDNAEYWQIEQAVTGGLSNWYIATDEEDKRRFLSMADDALEFFRTNVIDSGQGGTYTLNSASGNVVNSDKGSSYKAEFHSIEMFYYSYLYANLMLQQKPVTLYYSISPGQNTSADRQLRFDPVEIDNAAFKLISATLEGVPVTSINASSRTLELGAEDAGVLALTFGRD